MTASTLEPPTALAPPNAPGYRDLRMVAEWASAIRGDPLYFTYSPDTGRMGLAQFADGQPPLFTPPNATRPVVTRVAFAVEGATAPLPLDGHGCSALFWSESAVEKFLFPSFASACGDDAARFLGRLSNAWYGYPGRVVQVCALAYRYGTHAAAGPLSLDAAVGLVCLELATSTLKLMGLDEFEQTYATGAARGVRRDLTEDRETVPMAGWPAVQVGSIVAREAAEFVSGMRGRYVWFTHDDDVLTPWVCPDEYPGERPNATVVAGGVEVAVRPDRPAPTSVVVRLESGDEHPLVSTPDDPTTVPDAMFWTDGAVEKLLLPYYASVKGKGAPFFITILMGKWDNANGISPECTDPECAVTALRHYFPRTAPDVVDEEPVSPVYAITHLPRSEYVSDGSMIAQPVSHAALEKRTMLLTFDGTGFNSHPLFDG